MSAAADDAGLLARLQGLGLAKGAHVSGSSSGGDSVVASCGAPVQPASSGGSACSSSTEDSPDGTPRAAAGDSAAPLPQQRRDSAVASPDSSAHATPRISFDTSADPLPGTLQYFQPYDGYAKGCPAPPCYRERVETAASVYRKMELRDGELESTLRLLCKVFDVETATVSLLTGERIYLVGACGALPVCVCPDRWGFCGWSFLNPNHELNVVENMEEDARFSENYFVVNESFRLVFYVMAPLISSNGHRIGTLCIMGQQPRKFDATRGAILANLSEMLVRQIERRWALQDAAKAEGSRLMRSADAYTSAVGCVDASRTADWRLLHLNGPAAELLGVDWRASYEQLAKLDEGRHAAAWDGVPLAGLLQLDMTRAAWQAAQVELVLRGVRGVAGTPAAGKTFDVAFRLAASDALDEFAPFSVGVPSWLREASDPGPGRNLFFMHVRPAAAAAAADAAADGGRALVRESGLSFGPRLLHVSPIPDLVLGPLLGKGGYGRVFRGVHKGEEVAVKIIERLDTVRVTKEGVPIEVAYTQGAHHLGVARCLAWGIGAPDPALVAASVAAGSGAPLPTCWIVMELCDKHTLADAVVKGWFRTSRCPTVGGTALRTVALTAYEVASAMAYIHSHGVSHLDLSGGNVLLTSAATAPHGFAARVTDFGLARTLNLKARTAPGRYGTVTQMAPETIREGELSPACDAYAFGVLLWEMLTGSRAWAGLTHEAVLAAVGGNRQLWPPPGLPPVLHHLLVRCLSKNPADRPAFKDMLPPLEHFIQATRNASEAELTLPLRSSATLDDAGA